MAEEITEATEPMAKPQTQKSKSADLIDGLYYGELEETFTLSPYHPDSFQRPYNPDPLIRKDYSYSVYEEMMRDDQVNVAMAIKKDLVIGSGWYLDVNDDTQSDMKKELENLIADDTDRPFSEVLNDIIQAYEYGFSVCEKIFKKTSNGKLALKDIKPRHPSSWLLHTDDYGNVNRYEQRGPHGSIDVNPDSIIHYINNGKHQNPYGRSDLYPAYQAFMTKRHVSRFYAIYLESAASPKPVAKYDRRAPPSVVTDIFNAIKSFQTKTAMTIPKEFELEFLETKTNGEAYVKGLNLFNMYIGRALFIPDLVGFQGSETGGGSFSLGQEQIGLFYKHIYRRRQILERIIDHHVIRPLVVYNYGLQEDYPKFKFMPLSDNDAVKQAEMWIKGVQGAGYKPTLDEVNHFRNLIKFPQAEELEMKGESPEEMPNEDDEEIEQEDDETIEDSTSEPDDFKKLSLIKEYGGPGSGCTGENCGRPPGGDSKSSTGSAESGNSAAIKAAAASEMEGLSLSQKAAKYKESKKDLEQKKEKLKSAEKAAKAARSKADSAKDRAEKDSASLKRANDKIRAYNEAAKEFNDALDRHSVIQDSYFNHGKQYRLALSTLPGDYKKRIDFKMADNLMKNSQMKILEELEPITQDAFEDIYNQLEKSTVLKFKDLNKAESIGIKGKYLKQMQGVFKKHFRQLYKDSQIMAAAEIKRVDNAKTKNQNIPADEFLTYLEKETYQYVGNYEYIIDSDIKKLINQAIKDGRPISSVIDMIDVDTKEKCDISTERYSRTKSTEVFNRGRMEYFNSTGVIAAYQFAAILDDVTSEICGNLHGLTFPAGEAPVPPMHFNCRSVLVPITKYEDWSADGVTNSGMNVDKFLEENVSDKGFSVYSKEEKPAPPQITDPNVEMLREWSGRSEITTYSLNGKPFQITICTYEDDDKTSIKSIEHKRLDEKA